MKKTLALILTLLSFTFFTGCTEAEDLAADATNSFNNLKDGVTEVKENVEGTVETVQNGVDTVKATADNVTNTVNQVNEAAQGVSDLMNNE